MTSIKKWARVIVIGNLQKTFDKSVGIKVFAKEVSLYS